MHRLYFLLFSCLMFFSSNTFAIVNIESIRVQKKEDGFSGQLDIDANLKIGNTNKTRIGIGNRLQWIRGNITNFLVLNHAYGESSGMRDINKSFLHGRHVVQRNKKWAWEGFGQLEQNEFTRLSLRALAGIGVRRTLIEETGKTAIYLGTGGFYSTERLDDNSTDSLFRVNVYLVIKHAFNKNTHLIGTTYYQPAVREVGDFRALGQVALSVAISKKLDLKLSLDISHDSQPPTSVKSTDTSFRTGIEYRF